MSLAQVQRFGRKTAAGVSPSAIAIGLVVLLFAAVLEVASISGKLNEWRRARPLLASLAAVLVLVVLIFLASYLFLGFLPEDTFWLLVILACSPFSHGSTFFRV